jgi:hypothetical protein
VKVLKMREKTIEQVVSGFAFIVRKQLNSPGIVSFITNNLFDGQIIKNFLVPLLQTFEPKLWTNFAFETGKNGQEKSP